MPPTDTNYSGERESGGDDADARAGSTGDGDRWSRTDDGDRRGRLAAAAVGGALALLGARRRSLVGTAMALAGGWLLYRGVRGGRRDDRSTLRADQSQSEADRTRPGTEPTSVERSVTVDRPADELYEFWRDPEEVTRVLGDTVSVTSGGEERHHWSVAVPVVGSVEWDAEIVEDRPGEFLRWESVAGAPVPNAGSVGFRPAPADQGTEVTLTLDVDPPGSRVGEAALALFGVVPESLAGTALDRFKSLAETGEIPTLERNPSGRGRGDTA